MARSTSKTGTSSTGASKAGTSKAGTSKAGSSKAGSSKAGSSKAGSSKAGKRRAAAASRRAGKQGKRVEEGGAERGNATVARQVARKLDPTRPSAPPAASGGSRRRPAIEAIVRRAQGSLPAALLRRFIDADLMSQSAALALYAMLSLAPLLLLLVWLTSALLPDAQEALMGQIAQLMGDDAETVARTIVANAKARPDTESIAGWWSVLLLAVGATAVFAQLQDALNKIFRTDATRLPGALAWLRKRVFSLGLVLALGFLLLVSMTITTVLQLAFARLEWALPVMVSIGSWAVYALGFALMYHYLPDRSVGWRRALAGGAVTAVLFVLGRALIAWYLEHADPGSAYGAMGALVLALVWIYYAALVVFAGALLTAVVDERRKTKAATGPAS